MIVVEEEERKRGRFLLIFYSPPSLRNDFEFFRKKEGKHASDGILISLRFNDAAPAHRAKPAALGILTAGL
jgi:hypothetical protein